MAAHQIDDTIYLISFTYIMDLCELKFILILVIEHSAVLINERHDGGLPSWRPQESDNHVEEPVLPKHC